MFRAGKVGRSLLFVAEEEKSYIDLLRGRGVPLIEKERGVSLIDGEGGNSIEILQSLKDLSMKDRYISLGLCVLVNCIC